MKIIKRRLAAILCASIPPALDSSGCAREQSVLTMLRDASVSEAIAKTNRSTKSCLWRKAA